MWKRLHLNQIRRRLRTNDGGYSLLELIVTIAILASVGAGISALMVTGTRLYGAQSAQVRLQSKAQLLTAQLRSYYLSADGKIFCEDTESPSQEVLAKFPGIDACVVYRTGEEAQAVLYDAEEERLYLAEGLFLSEEGFPEGLEGMEVVRVRTQGAMLAEGVSAFSAQMPASTDSGSVTEVVTTVTLTDHGTEYETTFVTALRNRSVAVQETAKE